MSLRQPTVTTAYLESVRDATIYAPELPEARAFEILERLEYIERRIILPRGTSRMLSAADYDMGSAAEADEVAVQGHDSSTVLISAEHATSPFYAQGTTKSPTPHYRGADQGTGCLAVLLAESDCQAIIPLGRQSQNVAHAPDRHPLKQVMAEKIVRKAGFLSLHGMRADKLLTPLDTSQIHAVIGLGLTPNVHSRAVAEDIVTEAKKLGLRVSIGNDKAFVLHDPLTNGLVLDEDAPIHEPRFQTGRLMAHDPNMTTNFAYRLMQKTSRQIPALQLEISRTLRLTPHDFYGGAHADRKSQAMNVYLGFLLANCVVASLGARTKQHSVEQTYQIA